MSKTVFICWMCKLYTVKGRYCEGCGIIDKHGTTNGFNGLRYDGKVRESFLRPYNIVPEDQDILKIEYEKDLERLRIERELESERKAIIEQEKKLDKRKKFEQENGSDRRKLLSSLESMEAIKKAIGKERDQLNKKLCDIRKKISRMEEYLYG